MKVARAVVCHLAWQLATAVAKLAPTITVAPGIEMPMISFGIANHTTWIEVGGRGLDTAYVYGDVNQHETGQAVKNSGLPRSDLFVISKISCCPSSFPDPICTDPTRTPGGVRDAAADLAHDMDVLGLDYVDLMLIHWPCDSLDATVAMYKQLEQFKAAGKARGIGVSNFNATLLDALVSKVSVKPAINQVGFSIGGHAKELTHWGRDDVTVAKAKELGITTMAFAPLGDYTHVDVMHHPTVLSIAQAHGKNSAQIALRWIVQQGIAVVTRSNNRDHDISDLEIFDFELTADEMQRLTAIQSSLSIQI